MWALLYGYYVTLSKLSSMRVTWASSEGVSDPQRDWPYSLTTSTGSERKVKFILSFPFQTVNRMFLQKQTADLQINCRKKCMLSTEFRQYETTIIFSKFVSRVFYTIWIMLLIKGTWLSTVTLSLPNIIGLLNKIGKLDNMREQIYNCTRILNLSTCLPLHCYYRYLLPQPFTTLTCLWNKIENL